MMKGLFSLAPSTVDLEIYLNPSDNRQFVDVNVNPGANRKERNEKFPLYQDGESVTGKVLIKVKDGKRVEHAGIKVEFVGRIDFETGSPCEFVCLINELAVPGELRHSTSYDFDFKHVEKQYETYCGNIVRLRYFVRAKVLKRILDTTVEKDIWVFSYRPPPEGNAAIKMEVGIEQSLHIEFEYNKSRYHLKDIIVGKIYFLLVRIKIKHMELSIIKRESWGSGRDQQNDQTTLTTYEIMDGAPVRGETIPIRLFLSGFDLTPTFKDVNKKFSVRYYLNLVLVDEERRRYYKQQEITLLRPDPSENLNTSKEDLKGSRRSPFQGLTQSQLPDKSLPPMISQVPSAEDVQASSTQDATGADNLGHSRSSRDPSGFASPAGIHTPTQEDAYKTENAAMLPVDNVWH